MFHRHGALAVRHRQFAHAARKWQVEQFGKLGADLAGIGINRVAPDQNKVERPLALKRRRQRPRRGQGIRSGEGRVGDMHATISAAGRWPRAGCLRHFPGRG